MCNILIGGWLISGHQKMPESKSKPEFRAAVGFRKWDAREVVVDVIVSALKTKN